MIYVSLLIKKLNRRNSQPKDQESTESKHMTMWSLQTWKQWPLPQKFDHSDLSTRPYSVLDVEATG